MQWRKRIRIDRKGLSLDADVNASIAVNKGQSGTTNKVESVSHVRVVQDSRGNANKKSRGAAAPESDQEDLK
jgi:pyridoxal biosynthesis lyase PdxS